IFSSNYVYNETSHELEDCILYGDLLSGAFAEKLVAIDETAMLRQWLEMLQGIHETLVTYSSEERTYDEKRNFLVDTLVESLSNEANREACLDTATMLLLKQLPADDSQEPLPLTVSEGLKPLFAKTLHSSQDFMALQV
ncbi:MAG: hypothetical protein Q4C56_07495, partial [Peptococcaceae bacterium]|nr:hypothetical protein [Peptococcaceae bacterium]